MDEELVVRLYPESGDQWLHVWMEIGDKCVPQKSMLFSIFISDFGSGIECALSKPKLRGEVSMSEGWDSIKKDLDSLKQ